MPLISIDWLAEHVTVPSGTDAATLAADLVKVGLEEEAIHGSGITGPLVVGRVVSREPEEQKNGKIINWCQVDVGSHNVLDEDGQPTIPRGIICGAQNFDAGDLVVAALPGAVLPGPFPISSRKTYGHISDGMICSQRELGLGEDHSGIIVLDRIGFGEADGFNLNPGDDALSLLGLDVEVLEINVTPDRGYCFSMRGIAREYAHSTGATFTDPASLITPPAPTSNGFQVKVADASPINGLVGCDRFATRIVRGLNGAASSPDWMQKRLTEAGMRPISLIVDVTNYVMLDLGQPIHAYDLAKVAEPIVVRRAEDGEKLTTLDGTERILNTEDLLITDSPVAEGNRVLGLAGVMGGASSEVSDSTTDVLVEAAHFEQVTIARTARRHKLSSEAAKRFERGVDAKLPAIAAARVVELLVEHGGGVADDAVSDLDNSSDFPSFEFPLAKARALTGVDYSKAEILKVLTDIGCEISDTADVFADLNSQVLDGEVVTITPAPWRSDLTGAPHLVEEIARIIGYQQITPRTVSAPAGRGLTAAQRAKRLVSNALATWGLTEVLSYPFVGAEQYKQLGITEADERFNSVTLLNALQSDRNIFRTNVLTTLLDTTKRNLGRGNENVALFEIGKVAFPTPAGTFAPSLTPGKKPSEEELAAVFAATPKQPLHLAVVLTGEVEVSSWSGKGRVADWQDAIEIAQLVAATVGTELSVVAEENYPPFHPGRTAKLLAGEVVVGYAGQINPKNARQLSVPETSVILELDLDSLFAVRSSEPVQAVPVATFPVVKEDFAFVVDEVMPVSQLLAVLEDAAAEVLEKVSVFDIYTGEQLAEDKKSVAVSVRLRSAEKTLTGEEIAGFRKKIIAAVKKVGGELR